LIYKQNPVLDELRLKICDQTGLPHPIFNFFVICM